MRAIYYRVDWAAAHLGLGDDQKETLRAILKAAWDEGFIQGGGAMPDEFDGNPYRPGSGT